MERFKKSHGKSHGKSWNLKSLKEYVPCNKAFCIHCKVRVWWYIYIKCHLLQLMFHIFLLFIPDGKISNFKHWSTEEGSWVSSYGSKIQRKSLTGQTDCKCKLCNDKWIIISHEVNIITCACCSWTFVCVDK